VLKGRVFEVKDGKKSYYGEGDEFLEVPTGSAKRLASGAGQKLIYSREGSYQRMLAPARRSPRSCA
jgi:hypothetical protein